MSPTMKLWGATYRRLLKYKCLIEEDCTAPSEWGARLLQKLYWGLGIRRGCHAA